MHEFRWMVEGGLKQMFDRHRLGTSGYINS